MNKIIAKARSQTEICDAFDYVIIPYLKMLEVVNPEKNCITFAKQGTKKGDVNKCGSVTSQHIPWKFFNIYTLIRHYFEVIPYNTPAKLYFNIDGTTK